MNRKLTGRMRPTLEALEGRDLQSGLGASSQAVNAMHLLPYIEQDNLRPAVKGGNLGTGGQTQIIAILIGM